MKTAIVTGAGSGIGRAVALELVRREYALIIAGRTGTTLDQTKSLCGEVNPDADCQVIETDLLNPAQAVGLIDQAHEQCGTISVLINNAGIAPLESLGSVTQESVQQAFAINAVAPALMISRIWPIMVKQGGGRIVNVSSMATQDPFPGFLAYAASKCAVNSLARSIAGEGESVGIKGFAVAPGAVETGMLRSLFDEAMIPADACLSPAEVAQVIVDCADGLRDDENGQTILLNK
ncbi:MAG: SDR family oxidoreductase [Planctomycetes bacterium]|nr:SDR family oxidoreductase [Planctomycetota bacterium]NOG54063.1 SDR family oxidoreductase [Planctomycetota bacterium]